VHGQFSFTRGFFGIKYRYLIPKKPRVKEN
jgi:hypothetical protein